jgi:hypothetical protein
MEVPPLMHRSSRVGRKKTKRVKAMHITMRSNENRNVL